MWPTPRRGIKGGCYSSIKSYPQNSDPIFSSQDLLYQEIQNVCGSKKMTEEHLQYLTYLNATFHETLRLHPPVPIIPPRHVHEDTQLGGYNIPAGTDVIPSLPF